MKGWLAGALAALTLALASPVWGTTATPVRPGFDTLSGCPSTALTPCWKPWDATNPFPVTGTFSATLSGFTPTPSYSQIAASDTANHSVAAPTGVDDVISNLDTNVAYCNFGAASTTNTFPVPAGATFGFHNGAAFSTFQCQSPTSSLKITISGGAGLFTGGGGGGGGGGGASGNVFQATAFAEGTASTATTTQVFALSGTTTIYLVNYSYQTDAAATGNGTFQIVTGTGTNCSTIHQTLTPVWNFAQNAGIGEGSIGVLGASSAGDEMCVVTTATQKVNWRIGVVQQ